MAKVVARAVEIPGVRFYLTQQLERDQVVLVYVQHHLKGLTSLPSAIEIVEAFAANNMTARVARMVLETCVTDLQGLVEAPQFAATVGQRHEHVAIRRVAISLEQLV